MNLMILLAGFVAGLLCSLGGAIKDSPFEGFQKLKFLRSIVVGTLIGTLLARLAPSVEFWVALCICGYAERIAVESYKLVRAQIFQVYKPGKFALADPKLLGARLGFRKVV